MPKHPFHYCSYNDPPQSCDCYDKGFVDGKKSLTEILESVIKWVEDNHEHHEYGCPKDNDPYVDSEELVEYIKKISGHIPQEVN